MNYYESVVVFDSLLPEETIENYIEKFKKFILERKAELVKIDKWGKKKLAYEVRNKTYGFYVSFEFKTSNFFIRELENEYRLIEDILRFLTIKRTEKELEYFSEQEKIAKKKEAVKAKEYESENESKN